ncbi:hypothetical protein P4C99_05360 [Pontiellaceae bacterium B1224]|nr:hypothetical protein [Pontiellaceae bacterium B1224]
MKKKILLLRIIETVLLVVFTYSVSISEKSTGTSWSLFSFNLGFRVGSVPSVISFTTLSAGFGVSMLASLLMVGRVKFSSLIFPLVVAGFGLLDLISNSAAALGGNFIPVGLRLPLLLCVVDWVITFRSRNSLEKHAGINGLVFSFLLLCVAILTQLPFWLIKYATHSRSLSCAVFVETEVMGWLDDFDRDHFDGICHSQLIENSGGPEAFDKMWTTMRALAPYREARITGKNMSLLYEKNIGVLGGSRYDIIARSPSLSSDIYFRVYCREEAGEWRLSGFNVSDTPPEGAIQ